MRTTGGDQDTILKAQPFNEFPRLMFHIPRAVPTPAAVALDLSHLNVKVLQGHFLGLRKLSVGLCLLCTSGMQGCRDGGMLRGCGDGCRDAGMLGCRDVGMQGWMQGCGDAGMWNSSW